MAKKKEKLSLEEMLEQALAKEKDRPCEVPENWVWVKFGYLAENMADGPFGSNLKKEHYTEKKEVRIIQLSNIGENGWRDENTRYTTYEHAKTISRSMVKPGEIVIAKMMPAGRAIKVPNEENAYILSSDAVKFVPKKLLNSDYLLYAINSDVFRNQVLSETQGITRARTSIGKIKTYLFPFPPLSEQQRIVNIIEQLFEKLYTAKELVQNALDSFENRKAAILHKAFIGELTAKWREENGVSLYEWEETQVGKLCDCIVPGRDKPKNFTGSIPWITTPNINGDYIFKSSANLFLSIEEIKEVNAKIIPVGSVIMSCVGRFGLSAIVENECVINQQLHAFLPSNRIDNKYLMYNIRYLKDYMLDKSTSTTVAYLNKTACNSLPIKLPTLLEQKEIVRILDNLLGNEQRAKELCDVIEKIDLMKKVILAKAFRGELGTNDPEEESAVALLKDVLSENI